MVIAALFTIAKTWKQPKNLSMDRWIKKIRNINRERQILYDTTYVWNLKKCNKLVSITKKKQTHRYREQTSGYQWGD